VAPRWANVLRREETIQRASGALDVLKNARIVATLDEALDGMTHLCATAMTPRDFGPPTQTPRVHFEALLKTELLAQYSRGIEADLAYKNETEPAPPEGPARAQGMALLFGSERFGMCNEDVYRCHVCLSIPSDPQFGSLNLGAAVQVIAYEWRLALGAYAIEPATVSTVLADAQQVAGMLAHLEQSLQAIGFLDPQAPKKLMPRLNQLFNRSGLTQEEIHILRGIAKAMLQSAQSANAGVITQPLAAS
jgi:tRNA/rRNA methyltransferase